MKKNVFILLIVASILIVFSILIFASETIDVKDYIKGKFPVIFNIYLAPLGELDEYEKEFIDLLQNLPEEEQKSFAKEVYDNGFSKEILEKIKKEGIITKPKTEIEGKNEEGTKKETEKWEVSKKVNPIDDTTTIIFALESDSGKSVYGEPIYLLLRYKSKKTEAYINWNSYLGSEKTWVLTRIGKQKAVKWPCSISTDGKAAFYPIGIVFILELMKVDSLVAQVIPYNESPITAVFDVRGLKNAVEPYQNILHWTAKEWKMEEN